MSVEGRVRPAPLKPLALLLLLSFLGKTLFRLWFSDPAIYWKSGYSFYHRMAVGLLESGELTYEGVKDGLYPCFRLPAYPAFVAAISWLTNDSASAFIVCQAVVSTITVALVYWITRQFASDKAALASAALYAFFPYAFVHETQLQENCLYHSLSTLGIAVFLYALKSRRAQLWMLMAGLATGLAVLTRGPHLVPAMVLPITIWISPGRTRRQKFTMSAALLAGIFLAVAPWMIRNYRIGGRFALTSQAGLSFGVSHNSSTFEYYPYRGSIDLSWGAYQEKMPANLRAELESISRDEFQAADWYRQQALRYIQEHPLETIQQGVVKALVNFAGVLSPLADPVKNSTYFVSFWGLTVLALFGLKQLRGTPFWTVFWGLMLAQAAFSFVYYTHTSHRSYLDPFLAVPAGIGLLRIVHRHSAGRSQESSTETAQPAV